MSRKRREANSHHQSVPLSNFEMQQIKLTTAWALALFNNITLPLYSVQMCVVLWLVAFETLPKVMMRICSYCNFLTLMQNFEVTIMMASVVSANINTKNNIFAYSNYVCCPLEAKEEAAGGFNRTIKPVEGWGSQGGWMREYVTSNMRLFPADGQH